MKQIGQNNEAEKQRPNAIMGVVVMAVGCLPLLAGLGLIKVQGSSHAPLFVLTAVGIAFIMSGVMVLAQALGLPPRGILMRILAFLLICSFLTPFVWLAFLSGQPLMLRLAFGAPVVLFVLLYFVRFIPGVKVITIEQSSELKTKKISRQSRKL